jgi:conserved oligomeric Golgi complex subunit 2
VEKLIKELPSIDSDWSNGDVNLSEKSSLSKGVTVQHVENGTSLGETQSMLLERIASEMNRLKFYVTHAKVCFVECLNVVFVCFILV